MENKILSMLECSIMIAFSVVLDILFKGLPILQMPQGGRLSLTMLPIMIIGLRNGPKWGIIGGIGFGIVNFIIDGYTLHWASFLLDYVLAFGILGITGFFQKIANKPFYFGLAIILAGLGRYFFSGLSGVVLYGAYANELGYYNGMVWFYSFIVYNLPYLGASTLLCLIVGLAIKRVILLRAL